MASASGSQPIYRDNPLPTKSYPLRIGSSLRSYLRSGSASTGQTAREFSVIKFKFLPESTKLQKGGQLTIPSEEEPVVKFQTRNKRSPLILDTVRRQHQEYGSTNDYVLVFYRNKFWLEKVPDFFNCKVSTTKTGELSSSYLRQQSSSRGDDAEDADDWMKKTSS